MDTVTGKGGNVRVHVSLHVSVSCLLSGLFTSPPDYQHWQIYFFPSLVGVSACLLVCCPGWPFQLHASLSPRVPLLAARAKGESWACKEQCTPSAMFPILKLRLERWGYMAQDTCVFHLTFIQSRPLIVILLLWEKAYERGWKISYGEHWMGHRFTLIVVRKQFRLTVFANLPLEPMIYHTWYLVDDWDYTRKCLACWSIYSTQQMWACQNLILHKV